MTKPTDQLGHKIEIGDIVAVPVLTQGAPAIAVGVVSEADVVGGKGVLVVEGVRSRQPLQWAADIVRLERDPDAAIEQFLPVGTTFDAEYVTGFGTYPFTVKPDGGIYDSDGDEGTMEDIVLSSIHHVVRPSAAP